MRNKIRKKTIKTALCNFFYGISPPYKSTLLGTALGIVVLSITLPLMFHFDFYTQVVGANCPEYDTIASIYIACISVIASTIGLLITAFVFLNDSLKKSVEKDASLSVLVQNAINKKAREIIAVSVCCIANILLCIIGHVHVTNKYLLYFATSTGIALIIYIIVFAGSIMNAKIVIFKEAEFAEKKYRKSIKKMVVEQWEPQGSLLSNNTLPPIYTSTVFCSTCKKFRQKNKPNNDIIDNDNADDNRKEYIIPFIKTIHQIDVTIKAIGDYNVELGIKKNHGQLIEGIIWLIKHQAFDSARNDQIKEHLLKKYNVEIQDECLIDVANYFFTLFDELLHFQEALTHMKEKTLQSRLKEKGFASDFQNYCMVLAEIVLQIQLDFLLPSLRLSALNLGSSDFNDALLSYVDMSDSSFIKSNFDKANMKNAIIRHCDFSTSTFTNADLRAANFSDSNLRYCNLIEADLEGATLSHCLMNEIVLRQGKLFNFSKERFDSCIQKIPEDIIKSFDEEQDSTFLYCDTADQKEKTSWYIEDMQLFKNIIDELGINCENNSDENQVRVANLCNANLDETSLFSIDLSDVCIKNAIFKNSDLIKITALNTNANGADFSGANLNNSTFVSAELNECIFINSNLYHARIINTDSQKSNFNRASLMATIILGNVMLLKKSDKPTIDYLSSNWKHLSMENASFIEGIACYINFDESSFDETKFKRAVLYNSSFKNCSLMECDFSYSILCRNQYRQSNLRGMLASRSKLLSCDFKSANLSESIMIGAEIVACDFTDVSFLKSNLGGAIFSSCHFENSNMKQVDWLGVKFKKCVFKNMYLPKEFPLLDQLPKGTSQNLINQYIDSEGNKYIQISIDK